MHNRLNARNILNPQYQTAYWKDYQGNEVDFVVLKNRSASELIQATYAGSREEVSDREIKAIIKASKSLKLNTGKIITWDFEDEILPDGIRLESVPIWKWMGQEPG